MITKPDILKIVENPSIENNLKENNGQINIIWSGGCDSTLILYWILDWLKTMNSDRVINAWTFIHNQLNDNKISWERQKRQRFIIWAEDKGFKNKILNREIQLPKETISCNEGSCCQVAIWTSQIMPIINNDSLLFAGYHRGDDFFTYSIFNNWMNLFISLSGLYNKNNKFCVPLYIHTNIDIIKYIKEIPGLYDNTWWCESVWTEGRPCGDCLPCRTHQSALLYYEKFLSPKQQLTETLVKTAEKTLIEPNVSDAKIDMGKIACPDPAIAVH